MPTPTGFGVALTRAREALGLSQTAVALHLETNPNTVHRWERRGFTPAMEKRIELLRFLKNVPPPLLEMLAAESDISLASIGLAPVAVPVTAAPVPAPWLAPAPVPASAQATVDNAVREAAEEIDIAPKVLRPALSRLLDQLAKGGVPMDAAARMVLGVPKREKQDPAKKEDAT